MAVLFPQKLQAAIRSTLGLPALAEERPPQENRDELSKSLGTKYLSHLWENESERSERALAALGLPRLLPANEIVRELRRFRYESEFSGARRVPISCLASLCGIDRQTIYTAMMGQEVSHAVKAKLSWAIVLIREGRLRFTRRRQRWEFEFRIPPNPLPPPQPPLVRGDDFNEWSRCWACGSLKWSPVSMNGSRWHVCLSCVPKSQWRAIGASRLTSRSHHQRGWRG
jgi:hypothetical protein